MEKKAMNKLSYGLFVLTAKEAGKDNGCIINTAIQAAEYYVAAEPPVRRGESHLSGQTEPPCY